MKWLEQSPGLWVTSRDVGCYYVFREQRHREPDSPSEVTQPNPEQKRWLYWSVVFGGTARD